MQKAISLQPEQARQEVAIQEEMRGYLAEYGSITLRSRVIRKAIPECEERHRKLLRDTLTAMGISNYIRAQFDGRGNVVVEVPDESQQSAAADVPLVPTVDKPNGRAAERR